MPANVSVMLRDLTGLEYRELVCQGGSESAGFVLANLKIREALRVVLSRLVKTVVRYPRRQYSGQTKHQHRRKYDHRSAIIALKDSIRAQCYGLDVSTAEAQALYLERIEDAAREATLRVLHDIERRLVRGGWIWQGRKSLYRFIYNGLRGQTTDGRSLEPYYRIALLAEAHNLSWQEAKTALRGATKSLPCTLADEEIFVDPNSDSDRLANYAITWKNYCHDVALLEDFAQRGQDVIGTTANRLRRYFDFAASVEFDRAPAKVQVQDANALTLEPWIALAREWRRRSLSSLDPEAPGRLPNLQYFATWLAAEMVVDDKRIRVPEHKTLFKKAWLEWRREIGDYREWDFVIGTILGFDHSRTSEEYRRHCMERVFCLLPLRSRILARAKIRGKSHIAIINDLEKAGVFRSIKAMAEGELGERVSNEVVDQIVPTSEQLEVEIGLVSNLVWSITYLENVSRSERSSLTSMQQEILERVVLNRTPIADTAEDLGLSEQRVIDELLAAERDVR